MARTAARIYVPLDAGFFDDDRIITAGEKAAYLYLNMMTKAKGLDTNGVLSAQQLSRLGVPGWQSRIKSLVNLGLIEQNGDSYAITGWLKWKESTEARAHRLADERRRKAELAAQRDAERAKK